MAMTGGDKLDAYLKQAAARVSKPGTLECGFLEDATYPDGTSVATVAAMNEFGVPAHNQPPRPFFRDMIAAKSPDWGVTMGALLKANDGDGNKVLALMGDGIAGQLRDSIVALTSPPLSPTTVARKGSSKPLVNTGVMLQSVDYRVIDE
jgi:hypothetical protein